MTDYPTYPAPSGESGTSTTDVARNRGEQLTDTTRDAASSIGDTAASHGRDIADETRQHVRRMTEDARGTLRNRAQQETERAGSALGQAGGQLRALADGRIDEAGPLGDYVRQAAESVNRWADAVQDRGLDGLLDDLRSYGRRRPGMFLLGAMAAGVLVGRFGRNVAPEVRGDGDRRDAVPAQPRTPAGATYGARAAGSDIQPPVHPPTERRVQSPPDAPAYPPSDPVLGRPLDAEQERPT